MQLSDHFTLDELVHSDLASRKGIDNKPDADLIPKLAEVSAHILEPVRQHFDIAFAPTSGYRCLELNRLLGSPDKSQHVKGEAVDFKIPGVDNFTVAEWIYQNLTYDQLILECYSPGQPCSGWVHCSFVVDNSRGQVLTFTGKEYLDGLIS